MVLRIKLGAQSADEVELCFQIIDMPFFIQLYRQGRLKLDELVSARIGLDDINDGYAEMKKGEIARSVIMF